MGGSGGQKDEAVAKALESALAVRPRDRAVSVTSLMSEVRSSLPGLEISDDDLEQKIEVILVRKKRNIFFDR